MAIYIFFAACVVILCVVAEKCSVRWGMPALILFMFIGMLFGSDGIFKIPFDDFSMAEHICELALLFIMFYGGFNTKWKMAKRVAVKSLLLSTVGVVITAGLTALFCKNVLHFSAGESFLVGSVLASTDAASVFSILRTKNLNLKHGTASLLELESGSNDPVAYLLTMFGISFLTNEQSQNIALMLIQQMGLGCVLGMACAAICLFIMQKTTLVADGLDTIFVIGMMLLCYALTCLSGGNQFLSVYIMGIIVGNSPVKNKQSIILFFDGLTSLAQILIFFLLGLLTYPHKMPAVMASALAIAAFLTLVSRPITVLLLLKPFRCSLKQCLLVSWAGLRGAASSVFAIMAMAAGVPISHDLFHIVFMVSLFSVAVQGTLLPKAAEKLDMVDTAEDVRKTFNDYQEESAITLMRMYIPKGHSWENKRLSEVHVPTGSLALMIKRNGQTIITKGDTKVLADDTIILSVPSYEPGDHEQLREKVIDKDHIWKGKTIEELCLPSDELIALIRRGTESLIPNGKTVICENDVVVTYNEKNISIAEHMQQIT